MAKSKGGSGLFHNPKVTQGGDSRGSAAQNTSVGSGSRPTRSKFAINDSSPSDHKISERSTPGALK